MHSLIITLLQSNSGKRSIANKRIISIIYHILHNHHSVQIAIIVENIGLNLYMLTKKIKSERFHRKNISLIFLRRCGGENSIAKIALVKKSVQKYWFAIKTNKLFFASILNRNLASRKIRLYAIALRFNCISIQIWVSGRPFSNRFKCKFSLAFNKLSLYLLAISINNNLAVFYANCGNFNLISINL